MEHIKLFENYTVDNILDKISDHGMDSLNDIEKEFLNLHSIGEDDPLDIIKQKIVDQIMDKIASVGGEYNLLFEGDDAIAFEDGFDKRDLMQDVEGEIYQEIVTLEDDCVLIWVYETATGSMKHSYNVDYTELDFDTLKEISAILENIE